jgi:hypothetical protein
MQSIKHLSPSVATYKHIIESDIVVLSGFAIKIKGKLHLYIILSYGTCVNPTKIYRTNINKGVISTNNQRDLTTTKALSPFFVQVL